MIGEGAACSRSVIFTTRRPSCRRIELFAFANFRKQTSTCGATVRGFSARNTRPKICSGVSKNRTLSTCIHPNLPHRYFGVAGPRRYTVSKSGLLSVKLVELEDAIPSVPLGAPFGGGCASMPLVFL